MFLISSGFVSSLRCRSLTSIRCHLISLVRTYGIVKPGLVRPHRSVPDQIAKPHYINSSLISKVTNGLFSKMAKPDFKSARDIERMRDACQIARKVLNKVGQCIQPGVTTDELDRIAHDECISNGSYPSPLLYKGFPKSICTSVNNVACHGIPDSRCLEDGDIINVDVTVFYNGFHGDVSETFLVGSVDAAGHHLVNVSRRCRDEAIRVCGPDRPLSIIGEIVSSVAEDEGCVVIPEFCGHGIGTYFHGPPDIIHIRNNLKGKMLEGMTFTIEPVICDGNPEINILDDGWTAVTTDNSWSAQFEHTILITKDGAEILTK